MYRTLLVFLVLLLEVTAFSANATDLYGKVSISGKFIESLMKNSNSSDTVTLRGYWNEPNGVLPIAPPSIKISSDFGVVLFRDGADKPKADSVQSVNVLTGKLEKNVIVIRPESRIKFIMRSPFDHELYSPAKHDFKPQLQGNNSFRPVDFYTPGIFEVKDKLIPHFLGWVVVTPATYVLKVDNSGTFKFDGAEPGDYKIKVFYKGKWIYEKAFTVDGRKRELNITLNSAVSDISKKGNASSDKEVKDSEDTKKPAKKEKKK